VRVIVVAGPPSAGKTSVILKTAKLLNRPSQKAAIVKFDSLSTSDGDAYAAAGFTVATGLAGNVCPDHFFVSNIDDCVSWAREAGANMLIVESAGLCNRCSPHIQGTLAVCVVDTLSGIHTPRKIGPMLKLADLVLITKGDIVSQAEREVFAFNVRQANRKAGILFFNGITGQGATELAHHMSGASAVQQLEGSRLRFSMPSAVCPYCIGETVIGQDYQRGNVRKMSFEGAGQ
jgi:Ni2+-binding GTPase involved in maturation of urease and hydrogenase